MRKQLLRAHFLTRLLHNDLISPRADRHQVLAVSCAALVASGTFITVLLSVKYAFRVLQAPGWTAVVSLDDLFLYCALSMLVMAAVALAAWDALTLDARDVAILGWLPVPRRTLVSAQLTAVLLFALIFLVAVNLVPSVMGPLLRVSKLAIPLPWLLYSLAAQAVVTALAGLFGFVLVVGVREVLRAGTGARAFETVSAVVQTVLVSGVATALLALPLLHSGVERRWLAPASAGWAPPLWFVGLHDVLMGDVLEALPAPAPPADAPARRAILAYEAEMLARHRAIRPRLADLASTSLLATSATVFVAAAAWGWNSRRLPTEPPPPRARRRRLASALARFAGVTLVRHPCARAGFTFALQTLRRSRPHRVALASAAGVAIAVAGMLLARSPALHAARSVPDEHPLAAFVVQPVIVTVLIAGFLHASRIPAGLRANALLKVSWLERRDSWVDGVKKAGFVLVVLGPITALFPLHWFVLGPAVASAHAALIGLAALCVLELSFLGGRTVPFVSRYEPVEHALAAAPIYIALTLTAVYVFAGVERVALSNRGGALMLALTLAAVWLVLCGVSRRRSDSTFESDADDTDGGTLQRLNLWE